MRFTLLLAALVALAACATPATPSAASDPAPSQAAAPAPSRAVQLLNAAGRANAPTQAEIEGVLGHADIVRQDGAGAALTYRLEHCALLLLFEADERNALRLTEAHPGARRAGETVPNLDQCAAEAASR